MIRAADGWSFGVLGAPPATIESNSAMYGDYLFAAALTEPNTLTYLAGPGILAFSIHTP